MGKRTEQISVILGMFWGLTICVGAGAVIGSAIGNIEMGIGLAIPFGIILGFVIGGGISEILEKKNKREEQEEVPTETGK